MIKNNHYINIILPREDCNVHLCISSISLLYWPDSGPLQPALSNFGSFYSLNISI